MLLLSCHCCKINLSIVQGVIILFSLIGLHMRVVSLIGATKLFLILKHTLLTKGKQFVQIQLLTRVQNTCQVEEQTFVSLGLAIVLLKLLNAALTAKPSLCFQLACLQESQRFSAPR